MIKQFKRVFGYLSLILFPGIFTLAQNNINTFNEGIHIYPQEAIDLIEESNYDLVIDYSGREEIFSDGNKRLVLDIDGNILDLKNKNVTSKIKYSLQTSTFSRIPSAVCSKGYFVIKPDELNMIANANKLVAREIGLLRNYNYEFGENVINDFSSFVANNDMTSKVSQGSNSNNTLPAESEGYKTNGLIAERSMLPLENMGITVSNLPSSGKSVYQVESGVLVKKVKDFSEASISGFESGLVISHVNGRKVVNKNFLENYLQKNIGQKCSFTVKSISGGVKFLILKIN